MIPILFIAYTLLNLSAGILGTYLVMRGREGRMRESFEELLQIKLEAQRIQMRANYTEAGRRQYRLGYSAGALVVGSECAQEQPIHSYN